MPLWLPKQFNLSARRVITVVIFLLPLLYFYPAVLGRVLLVPGDGWSQNYPLRTLVGQMLTRGELPLWNPYIFGGMPLLATVYPGAAYPPNWIFALLPSVAAMNIVVVTTYHIALIGAYRLGRSFGWQRGASLCMALAFSFSSYLVAHLSHTSRIAAAAWLPWVILAIEKLSRQVTLRWISLGVLAVGLQMLAGEPQMWLFTGLIAAPYALWNAVNTQTHRMPFLLACSVMYIGGLALGAVQWLPAWELVRYGERAAYSYEAFTSFAVPPSQLPGLWLPFFTGGTSTGPYRAPYAYWGLKDSAISGFVGMLPWLLALVAIGKRTNDEHNVRRRFVWFWACMVVISLLFAMGDHVPVLPHILYRLPGFNVFRGPYRHLLEYTFALSVLAGYGWHRLESLALPARRKLLTWASIVLALIVLVCSGAYVFLTQRLFPNAPVTKWSDANVSVPLLFLLVSIAASFWYWRREAARSRWASVVLLSLLALDLAMYGQFFFWRDIGAEMAAKANDTVVTKRIKELEKNPHEYRIVTQSRSSDQPDWGFDAELINYPNTSLLRGLQSLNGYDVLRLTRLERLLEQDGNGLYQAERTLEPAHRGYDLLNTKYMIFSTRGLDAGWHKNALAAPPHERWRPVEKFGSVTLYENLRVLPRAWLVKDARTLASVDALQTIQTSTFPDGNPFDPRQTVIFSRREIPQLPMANAEAAVNESVSIQRYSANTIELTVTTPQPRWLVLSEMDYPGWKAVLDGEDTAIYRANYLLRAAAIPAGTHKIEFRYAPTSFLVGVILSVGTLIILSLSFWFVDKVGPKKS